MNLYIYVMNDPLNNADPNGTWVVGVNFGGEGTVNGLTGPDLQAGNASTGSYVSNQNLKGESDYTAGTTFTSGSSDGFRADGGPSIFVLPESGPAVMQGAYSG